MIDKLHCTIYKAILFIIALSSAIINAENIELRILMKLPDFFGTVDIDEWRYNYEESINQFINDSDITLHFNYYFSDPVNQTYNSYSYFYNAIDIYALIEEQMFDMVVMDNRLLFSELSFVEDMILPYYFNSHRKPSVELLMDLSDDFKKEDLNYHDKKILSDGYYDGKLYGLPFEMDYEVLYYRKNDADENLNNWISNMEKESWDTLLSKMTSASSPYPLNIGLGYDEDLLNLFLEYTSNKYTLSKEYDPDYFKVFYNETADDVFNSFHNFMMKYTLDNVEDSIYLSLEDAFISFISGGSTFFKGKASHHQMFSSDSMIASTLPPQFISSKSYKYLTINKASLVSKEILIEVAKKLTSKEMQLFRAENFGTIPTFDTTNKELDAVNKYCENYSLLCDQLGKIKPIYIKDIFNTENKEPYFNIELDFPDYMRDYLIYDDYSIISFAFQNNNEYITSHLGIYGAFSYLFVSFTIACLIFIIVYVHLKSNHPYLKVISPKFCNLIIIGCIMSLIKCLMNLPPYSITKAKFTSVYGAINTSLIYIPMFVVTMRIYRIYNSETVISRKLTNTRLFIVISVLTLAVALYRFVICFCTEFYYQAYADTLSPRYPVWFHTHWKTLDNIYLVYMYGIVSILCSYIYTHIVIFINKYICIYVYIHIVIFINIHIGMI